MKFTKEKQKKFLEHLASTGNVTASAALVGMSRRGIYKHRDKNMKFAVAWEDALEDAADSLEAEARRRAVEGVDEPVYYQGKPVGYVRKHSDAMLMFLLKGNKPDKFRERFNHEHTGKDGSPLVINVPAKGGGDA